MLAMALVGQRTSELLQLGQLTQHHGASHYGTNVPCSSPLVRKMEKTEFCL